MSIWLMHQKVVELCLATDTYSQSQKVEVGFSMFGPALEKPHRNMTLAPCLKKGDGTSRTVLVLFLALSIFPYRKALSRRRLRGYTRTLGLVSRGTDGTSLESPTVQREK